MNGALSCFKSYDVRGRLDETIDAEIVYRIGCAFAAVMTPGVTVTGRDIRPSSAALADALVEGLADGGSDVIDIGLCGTEEVYFATSHYRAGGGLMVTASHNPIDYNGIKMVREDSRPISREDGLGAIHDMAAAAIFPAPVRRGDMRRAAPRPAYAERVLSFVDAGALAPLRILVNAGNGTAGPAFDAIAARLAAAGAPLDFVRLHHDPDGSFPNGIPNPLLAQNRSGTADAVVAHGADLGVAWDGDFDRCFLFDETGGFVDGEYIVGLLAAVFLAREPGARIVHDPRLVWSTRDAVGQGGGEAVVSRTGHAPMKTRMRETGAVYGGEMSAHHYFRDFMHCDSGMIPWLLVAEHVSRAKRPLSALVAGMRQAFPSSGEINFRLANPAAAMRRVEAVHAAGGAEIDRLDGLSVAYPEWRFNLRLSNTEPLLRLNVETRGDHAMLKEQVAALREMIEVD